MAPVSHPMPLSPWIRAACLTLAFALVCAAPHGASAQSVVTPSANVDSADDADVRRRLEHIERHLASEQAPGCRWQWIWTVGQGVLAVAQGVGVFVFTDRATQPGMIVGAITALVGGVPMVLFPLDACSAPGRLAGMPAGTSAERRARLRRAEQVLRVSAEGEAFGTGWIVRSLAYVIATGAGAALWLGYGQRESAAITFGLDAIGGELQIRTQPVGSVYVWNQYVREHPEAGRTVSATTLSTLRMALTPAGFTLGGRF